MISSLINEDEGMIINQDRIAKGKDLSEIKRSWS
jgi:hypothetical protein